ncbi:MAG: MlaE family lipid ABC transporter permease subunit [Steroidobacter sp.]
MLTSTAAQCDGVTVSDPVLFEAERSGDKTTLRLRGGWCIDHLREIEAALAQFPSGREQVALDYSGIETLDLSGAWLLRAWLDRAKAAGTRVEVTGEQPAHFAFLEELTERKPGQTPSSDEPQSSLRDVIAWLGRGTVKQARQTKQAISFFGRIAVTSLRAFRSIHHLRLTSITRHIYETGIQAIPIVSLIAFLISVIVAYLGAQQLRQFGAEIFTVDLVAVSVLREMGVLLTSIIVAGRSGSAFAAEIGVMRLNDEIDALQSMGVDHYEVLVLPRLIGLLVALPLLTIVSDAMGLAGGALLSSLLLDISLTQFIPRVQDALAPTMFWAGLIKAPVFAILIALVGTYRGMQVRDSSRELGRLTTVAVVQSIFLVIFADAIFAVVFVELDF